MQEVSQLPETQQQVLAQTLPAIMAIVKDMKQQIALAQPNAREITIKKTAHATNLLRDIEALQETLQRNPNNPVARKQLQKLIKQLENAKK